MSIRLGKLIDNIRIRLEKLRYIAKNQRWINTPITIIRLRKLIDKVSSGVGKLADKC